MNRAVYLDPHADNPPLAGCVVVVDPVGFIEQALDLVPLHIQGQDLCDWADTFGAGRGWQTHYLQSRVAELTSECPDLAPDEARTLLRRLDEDGTTLHRPLRLRDLAMAFWDRPDLWKSVPSDLHAFRWLAWLAQSPQPVEPRKLVEPLARAWHAQADPRLQRAYAVQSPEEAWERLEEWLRAVPSLQMWPKAPEPLPQPLQRRLEDALLEQAVAGAEQFFRGLLARAPELAVLRAAAHVGAQVLLKNPDQASGDFVRVLCEYVSPDECARLRELVPPANPGLPDWSFPKLASWFREKYLPYRKWSARTGRVPAGDNWVEASAATFAQRFLEYFAQARVGGGDGSEHLSWVKSARLRSGSRDAVWLLVILDGLGYLDADELRKLLDGEVRRLALDSDALALAPLPTVTEFDRDAVAKGASPAEAPSIADTRIHGRLDEAITELLDAQPGEVVVWKDEQPDRSYHFEARGSIESVREEVRGELVKIVQGIARAVEGFAPERRLRVVLTTDHGRLLTRVERSRPIPAGMKAHGRAAWGPGQVVVGASGFEIQDGLAYLHPARFGLPPDQKYAVILGEESFVMADGRSGVEPFPHGGLFPEEVFVPWLEFTRDREVIKLIVALTGQGEEGKPEAATLAVDNVSPVDVRLARIKLPAIGADVDLGELVVGAYRQAQHPVALPRWPSKAETESLTATLVFLQPNGEPGEVDFRPELQTVSMYERGEDILKDLDLGDL